MIHVTSAAARELRSLLKHSRAVAGHAVRLIPNRRGGVAMLVGAPKEGDVVIEENGAAVLIIAAELVGQLDGLVFDWNAREVEGEARRDFGLRRPAGDDEVLLSSVPSTVETP
jgi:Fe-S cluster assembly iron-binding protein IscA